MEQVLRWGRYRVYIYREVGERHHSAHCHVYWPDGRAVVRLSDWRTLRGDEIPASLREQLSMHAVDLLSAWVELNGEV